MQQELFIAIMAGIAGMIGWGFADFFAKKSVDKIGDIPSLVWAHLFGTIGFLFITLYQFVIYKEPLTIPQDASLWLGLAFFGALQAAIYLLVYKAFAKGQLAVLNPIFASYSGLTALVSILVLGEIVTGNILLAILTIFVGAFLLSIDFTSLRSKKLNFNLGVKEVALAALLATFWTLGWDKFISGKDWTSFALYMYFFMTLTAYLFARFKNIKLKVIKEPQVWSSVVMIGLCEMVAYLGISLGYSLTSYTSIVAVLSGAFSLPTLILARLFLKEKITRIQTIGGIIIIVGIILLGSM